MDGSKFKSPFGPIAVGCGMFALWLLLAGEASLPTIASGVIVSVTAAFWARLLDS